jgi:tetratricopeptide (TPR) repeat protein
MAEGHQRRRPGVRAVISWALVLGLALVGGGVTGAFAPSPSLLLRAGGAAVGAALGLIAVLWAEWGHQRSEAKAAAWRAREKVLDKVVTDPVSDGSLFEVLLATNTEAPPFQGRKDELGQLERWWKDPKQLVAMVSGPAGIGKTRLVAQFALERTEPWFTGWLSDDCGAEAVAAVRACGDPALILVDDVYRRGDVAKLLNSLGASRGSAGPAVRVILINRAPDLANQLGKELDDRYRDILDGAEQLPVGPFGGPKDRARWFVAAVRAYAGALGTPPPDLPAQLSGQITNPDEPILTLHARALLVVLESKASRPLLESEAPRPSGAGATALPFARVVKALFDHEENRWQALAARPEFGLTGLQDPVLQEQAIAVLAMASPADEHEAVAVLGRVPEVAKFPALASIARWAARLYPSEPPWPIRIKPDMLAESFVVTQLTDNSALRALPEHMTGAQKAALLELLARASDHTPQAARLFAGIIDADVTALTEAGVAAALAASTGLPRLDSELARLIVQVSWSADALGRIEGQLTGRLPRTQAAAGEIAVKLARADSDAATLADALTILGNRLDDLGRYQEALAATEEAIGLYRPLAEANPVHQPALALALTNLGIRLARLGRYQEALAAVEQAIGLWRRLAEANPAHYPRLATALGNLGRHLGDLGRYQEALAADEEAVRLWRRLAEANPAHKPDLAVVLRNLGIGLGNLGRHQEALIAAEEAVGLWRALAVSDPEQYQETYNRELAKLRRDLELRGQESASILLHLGDSPDPDKPQHIPPTPNTPER